MARRHVIDFALDLARMPALARSSVQPALPPNIVELMRIAAACPEACEAAVAETGEPVAVVIEAARFYLQQVLFRPDADCYRVLGIEPTPRGQRPAVICAGCWNGCILIAIATVGMPFMLSAFSKRGVKCLPLREPLQIGVISVGLASSITKKKANSGSNLASLDRAFRQTSIVRHAKFLRRTCHLGDTDQFSDHFFGFVVSGFIISALSRWYRHPPPNSA